MNWKNDGIWLLLLIPIIGFSFALGTNISGDLISLLLLAIVATLLVSLIIIIRKKKKHTR